MEGNIMPLPVRTEGIYLLRDLLQNKISAGNNRTFSVYVNDKQPSGQNTIRLFYTGDTDWVSESKANYYRTNIQVAVRHNDYDSARTGAYTALEYINAHRKDSDANYFIPDTTPISAGQDDKTKGYWWVFTVNIKGVK
jgi:hypothetical protein